MPAPEYPWVQLLFIGLAMLVILVIWPDSFLFLLIAALVILYYTHKNLTTALTKWNEAIEFAKNNPKFYRSCPSCDGKGVVSKYIEPYETQDWGFVAEPDDSGHIRAVLVPKGMKREGGFFQDVKCEGCNGIGYMSSNGNPTTVDEILMKKADTFQHN